MIQNKAFIEHTMQPGAVIVVVAFCTKHTYLTPFLPLLPPPHFNVEQRGG